jgi:hypothetical protein
LTFDPAIEQGLAEKINNFDEKSSRIIRAKLVTPSENPWFGKRGDKEKFCLKEGFILYRLHIG